MERRLNLTQAIRQALAIPGYGAEQIKPILAAIAPALRSGAAADPVRLASRRYLAAFGQIEAALDQFAVRAGRGVSLDGEAVIGTI